MTEDINTRKCRLHGENIDVGNNSNIALTPFHFNQANSLYSSQNALQTKNFGYTYPEIVDWGVTPAQLSTTVKTTVNNLYGPNASKRRRRSQSSSRSPASNPNYEYFINVQFDSSQLSTPLQIHFFVGTIPQTPSTWATASTLAGTFPAMSHTDNTQVGQLTITDALGGVQQLADLSPGKVVPYLHGNLGYRVQNANGTVIDARDVPGLQVAVVGRLVEQPASAASFPTYGPLIEYADATTNIVGG